MDSMIKTAVLAAAAKSPCSKRKVGAVITDSDGCIVGMGFNHFPTQHMGSVPQQCEDSEGNTLPGVMHAEIHAIYEAEIANISNSGGVYKPMTKGMYTMYVSHQPCENCQAAILAAGITNVEVVEEFMKFDTDKLRYDLTPSEWSEGDAQILTGGAKKYKPNNWRQVPKKDIMKYYAACERHMQDWRKFMEGKPDSEIFDRGEGGLGYHHLKNARTNLGFLLTLTETVEKAEAIRKILNE